MSRRKQLILKYTLASLGVVLAACGAVLLARRGSAPYVPGQVVEGITQDLARKLPPDYPRVQFSDVTERAGIRFQHFQATRSTQLPEDMGSGAAWGDYDNDGFPDLYVVDVAAPLTASAEEFARAPGGNRLYHNNRDGTFTDVTAQAGVGFHGAGMAAAWADYDNDGRLDLVATSFERLVLYHNNGDGTFAEATARAGLAQFRGFWTGAAWGDFDRDGRVDLYVCGYVQYRFRPGDLDKSSTQYATLVPFTLNPSSYPPERNLLLRNNGDGTFTDVAGRAGVDNRAGRSLSAAWADFDGDGWVDLYVANDVSESALYLNLRNGRFKAVSHEAWVSDYRGAMGLAIGDWDRDGDSEIFITHWIAQQDALFDNLRFTRGARKPGRLRFEDIADVVGIGQLSLTVIGWGTSFFDYDNDGQLDLLVVNGSTFQEEKDPTRLVPMKNFLFWQKSPDEGFFEVGAVSGEVFEQPRVGRGAAFADYDNDGDVDVFIVNQEGRATLLRNDGGNRKNWLKVRVQGARSNRSGFGTRVEVEAAGQVQFQEIGGQASYLSQNSQEAHFGLNQQREAERLTVTFPSGVVRTLEHVPANQTITVEEGSP